MILIYCSISPKNSDGHAQLYIIIDKALAKARVSCSVLHAVDIQNLVMPYIMLKGMAALLG